MRQAWGQHTGNLPVTTVCIHTVTDCVMNSKGLLSEGIPVRMIEGELCNGCFSERIPFYGFHDLVMKLEAVYDALDFPQRGTEARGFGEGGIARYARMKETVLPRLGQEWDGRVMQGGRGKRATFSVHTYARQNGSWQGVAKWLEGKETSSFRSVLELCHLMESALDREMMGTRDRETQEHGGTEA